MRIFTFALTVMLVGCASAPTELEIQNANYGQEVDISTCIDVAQRFIRNKMKDPNSALFTDVKCYQGWEGNVPIAGVYATYGYRFVGNVNAKNSYGGYTGYSPFSGIVRDNGDGRGARVVRYCIVSSTDEYQTCIPSYVP